MVKVRVEVETTLDCDHCRIWVIRNFNNLSWDFWIRFYLKFLKTWHNESTCLPTSPFFFFFSIYSTYSVLCKWKKKLHVLLFFWWQDYPITISHLFLLAIGFKTNTCICDLPCYADKACPILPFLRLMRSRKQLPGPRITILLSGFEACGHDIPWPKFHSASRVKLS